jgi:hypothetical protein
LYERVETGHQLSTFFGKNRQKFNGNPSASTLYTKGRAHDELKRHFAYPTRLTAKILYFNLPQ